MFWLYALFAWLTFAALAIAQGVLRVRLAEPVLGLARAHAVCTLLFCGLLLAGIRIFLALTAPLPVSPWALGTAWTLGTAAFEFLFGRYVAGHSWRALLADYNLARGRIWPLVLLTLLVGPWLLAK